MQTGAAGSSSQAQSSARGQARTPWHKEPSHSCSRGQDLHKAAGTGMGCCCSSSKGVWGTPGMGPVREGLPQQHRDALCEQERRSPEAQPLSCPSALCCSPEAKPLPAPLLAQPRHPEKAWRNRSHIYPEALEWAGSAQGCRTAGMGSLLSRAFIADELH